MSGGQQWMVGADGGAESASSAGTGDPAAGRLAADDGFSTAELLGNAALGITALVAVWALLRTLGLNVVQWIGSQIGVGVG